ncbi:unnamed protein product, partial [Ectocarpus sp. 4 AP-2014]
GRDVRAVDVDYIWGSPEPTSRPGVKNAGELEDSWP